MDIEQFKLMIIDTFELDKQYPPYIAKWKKEFRKTSYYIWSLEELVRYVTVRLYPRKRGEVIEFYNLTNEFNKLMKTYSKTNRCTNDIFKIAYESSKEILEVLCAMEGEKIYG